MPYLRVVSKGRNFVTSFGSFRPNFEQKSPNFASNFLRLEKNFTMRVLSTLPTHVVVGLPALSPTMESGTISKWMLKEGDSFGPGDVLCQVETDKATVDFESQEDGIVGKILVPAGSKEIKVGDPILITVEEESSVEAFKNHKGEETSTVETSNEVAPSKPSQPIKEIETEKKFTPKSGAKNSTGRIFASPKAKYLANQMNYPLEKITGTGPNGRIISADVYEYKEISEPIKSPEDFDQVEEYSSVHQTEDFSDLLRQKMTLSKQTIPHYYLTVDLNLDEMLESMKLLNQSSSEGDEISLNVLLVKAASLACKAVPSVNSFWMENFVRQFEEVNINLFMASEFGVISPLIRNVQSKGIKAISNEIKDLTESVKEKSADKSIHQSGTFSVINLGSYGINSLSPIVVPPQACILGLGAAERKVVPSDSPSKDEVYKISTYLKATLSCDHRVVDGAVGAQWLQAYKKLVENPITLLL